MTAITRALLFLACLTLLDACGFHLRGSSPSGSTDVSNINSVFIQSTGANRLADEVFSQLQSLDINVSQTAANSQYLLNLENEQEDRRVLTVDSSTGKVTEYELSFDASVTIHNQDGDILANGRTVRARRDLTVDEDAVLGKFEEERLIQDELRRQAGNNVIRILQAVSRNP